MPLRLSDSKSRSPEDSHGKMKKMGARPKNYDNGGYVKHPVRGPDVFGLKPRRQLESIVSEDPELKQISRSRSLRYSSLRSDDNSKIEHTKSVLEKAKTNRIHREKRLYEQKVDNYMRDQKNATIQEVTPYRTIYNELYNINTEQDLERTSTGKSRMKSKSANRRNMSKSAQGTFKNTGGDKNATTTTDTRNNKMTRSKHSVQLSDSTAVQSAVTKSTRITGRTFKFKKESTYNRYNATTDDRTSKSPGLSESRKLEDVSIFENEDRASSLDKEISRIAARTSPAVNLGYKKKKKKVNLLHEKTL